MKIMTMQFKESYRHSWIATVADDVQSICMFDLLKSEPIISPCQYNLFIEASVDKIRKFALFLNLTKYNHPSEYNHKMSKLKNSICRPFAGILSVLLCNCSMMQHPVALDDVSGFKIDVEVSDVERKTGYGLTILRLDGLLKDSALGITKTEIRQKHGRVHIMLYKGLADARSSGRIHATFLIDGKINTVMFGTDRQVVWQQPD